MSFTMHGASGRRFRLYARKRLSRAEAMEVELEERGAEAIAASRERRREAAIRQVHHEVQQALAAPPKVGLVKRVWRKMSGRA